MISVSSKIERALALKDEGNNFFKEGRYSKAKSCYGKCLAYITGFPGSKRNQTGWEQMAAQSVPVADMATDEEEIIAADLEKVIHQNIAACFLKMETPQKAVTHADKALALDKRAWKAMLRKGEAYMMMGSLDEAKNQFQVVVVITKW
jgi:tetratricopeptide (TPR) repeat protein